MFGSIKNIYLSSRSIQTKKVEQMKFTAEISFCVELCLDLIYAFLTCRTPTLTKVLQFDFFVYFTFEKQDKGHLKVAKI